MIKNICIGIFMMFAFVVAVFALMILPMMALEYLSFLEPKLIAFILIIYFICALGTILGIVATLFDRGTLG
jgi:hypothetical protein